MFIFDFNTTLFCLFLYIFYSVVLKKYLNSVERSTSEIVPISASVIKLISPTLIGSSIHKPAGKLHCFVGPMFSGKTTTMLSKVVQSADVTNTLALVINHNIDRGRVTGNGLTTLGISSHSSQYTGISAKVVTKYTTLLSEVDVSNYSIIGIDEIQLYTDLYNTVSKWLLQGKHIYCSGLDGDFLTHNFGQVHLLLPISDTFNKLCAVCEMCTIECKAETPDFFIPAPFTAKKDGDRNVIVDQGGKDKYIAVCRYHLLQIESK
jgi:thymidine kinase